MPIIKSPQVNYSFKRLEYAQHKLMTHSDNMARAHVPNAKTKTLPSFDDAVRRQTRLGGKGSSMRVTNVRHISPVTVQVGFQSKIARHQPQTSLSGNSISTEEELLGTNEASTMSHNASEATKNFTGRARMATSLYSGR